MHVVFVKYLYQQLPLIIFLIFFSIYDTFWKQDIVDICILHEQIKHKIVVTVMSYVSHYVVCNYMAMFVLSEEII